MMRIFVAVFALMLSAASAWAKLPAPPMTEEQKTAAEAAKAKAAEAAKKESELLSRYQDKAVANYKSGQAKQKSAARSKAAK